MGDLSEHFNRSEFRCHGFGHPHHPDHDTLVSPDLVALLEKVRAEHHGPVHIVSGHRCRWWNERIGGAHDSAHMAGHAADLNRGVVRPERAHDLGAVGVGRKRGWATHVDVRDGPRADWSYD